MLILWLSALLLSISALAVLIIRRYFAKIRTISGGKE
jgi:hypothetical protein